MQRAMAGVQVLIIKVEDEEGNVEDNGKERAANGKDNGKDKDNVEKDMEKERAANGFGYRAILLLLLLLLVLSEMME